MNDQKRKLVTRILCLVLAGLMCSGVITYAVYLLIHLH